MFELHPAFPPTSEAVGELPLCHVRLQADARYPWIVLIPRLKGLREIEELSRGDRARLTEEIVLAGSAVRALGEAQGRPVQKLNVGALGNVTPQLHIHVVGRRSDDAAWPGPVWGAGAAQAYSEEALAAALAVVRGALEI